MTGCLNVDFEKRYQGGTVVKAVFDAPVKDGYTSVLFGPSGCGKTTVLRSIAGLEQPEAGAILFGDEVWFDTARSICLPPQARDIGFLFQDYALFPHLTIGENVGYGLPIKGRDRQKRIAELLERFQLSGLEHRYPSQTSGGQQQRAALARALARRPRLLLLDEPLAALDANLRAQVRMELRRTLSEVGIPVILVTHDRIEAMALADQVVVMERGAVLQRGSVDQVFSKPANSSVAKIVGVETVEAGQVLAVADGLATVNVRGAQLLAVAPPELTNCVHVCIKGEDVILLQGPPTNQSSRNQLAGTIQSITPEGPLLRIGIDCGFALTALVTRPACDEMKLQVGDPIMAAIKAPAVHLIPRR